MEIILPIVTGAFVALAVEAVHWFFRRKERKKFRLKFLKFL